MDFRISGESCQAHIVEIVEDHQDAVGHSLEHVMFRCSKDNDKYEEITAYNDHLKYISKAKDDPVVCKFKQFVRH